MTAIAFIGLGNMGGPMAADLAGAGHRVVGFDLDPASRDAAEAGGVAIATSGVEAVREAEVVVTMLPAGKHVTAVWSEIAPVVRGARRRLLHGRRRERASRPCDRGRVQPPLARCTRLRRDGGRQGRDAHLHGRRRRGRFRGR